MKIKTLTLIVSSLLTAGSFAATNDELSAQLSALETRLKSAEQRAEIAEGKINNLMAEKNTPADVNTKNNDASLEKSSLKLTGTNELRLYGDVEFNIDSASKSTGLGIIKNKTNSEWGTGSSERWDINGRLLIGLDGVQHGTDGKMTGFSVQPLANLNGNMNVDDALFYFGQKDDWQVKVGRFEAFDMFPLNNDTIIEYSGNTANDLYADGYGYIYMMKEGRGRSKSGGNLLLSKTSDNWYFEVNTLLQNGTSLFSGPSYHGNDLENKKNVAIVRPVLSWQNGAFSTAIGMESNIVNNAYGYNNGDGRWVDQSKRNGYGFTMKWDGLKKDPDGMVINLNTAYLDASDETDFTAGINALWHHLELGYIYANNKIERFNSANIDAGCLDSCWLTDPGKYDIHTIHTSYLIPNVMDFPGFNIYLGAYASWLDASSRQGNVNTDPRYGARVRFKYYF